jgi:hypothetical protein
MMVVFGEHRNNLESKSTFNYQRSKAGSEIAVPFCSTFPLVIISTQINFLLKISRWSLQSISCRLFPEEQLTFPSKGSIFVSVINISVINREGGVPE